ncbi:hypothetical protein BGX27_011472 [Mortierella sp. AM989]|nr:hypothetical protein BGX27_011472 [Mortierella sp. AM989]
MCSLLLTTYKGHTSTVIARALVSSLIIGDKGEENVKSTDTSTPSFQGRLDTFSDNTMQSSKIDIASSFQFNRDLQDAVLDDEPVQLNYESGGRSLVLMTPYIIGWKIPKALKHVPRVRVNILLVTVDPMSDSSVKIMRVLKANIDARPGFQFIFIPKDIPRKNLYQFRIEIHLTIIWFLSTLLCLFTAINASSGYSSSVNSTEINYIKLTYSEQNLQGDHLTHKRRIGHHSKSMSSYGHWHEEGSRSGRAKDQCKRQWKRSEQHRNLSKNKKMRPENRKNVRRSKGTNFRFHLPSKSTLRRNGRIYAFSHQDWYSKYRRHRAPRAGFRKLNLESPRRRKPTFTVAPIDNDVDDENGGGSGGSVGRDQNTGSGSKVGESNEQYDIGEDERAFNNRTQSIQSVKSPKFMGPPIPVSIQHTGLIPREKSNASHHGGWSMARSLVLVLGMIVSRAV